VAQSGIFGLESRGLVRQSMAQIGVLLACAASGNVTI
jgi:hypothetical protein